MRRLENTGVNQKFKVVTSHQEANNEEDVAVTKNVALLRQIVKDRNENKRVLVFSDNNETFAVMDDLRDNHITCDVLHGSSGHVRKLIEAHQKGDIMVLFLNRRICGEGIHLAYADSIIFYHTLTEMYQYTQAIARANRFPRHTPLAIYHLYANSEVPPAAI